MISHAKILVPLLAVAIAIIAATIGLPESVDFFTNNNDESSLIPIMSGNTATIDGMPFPTDIKVAGSKQSLIGGGTRHKWGIRVYAVGIYSDQKLARTLTKKYSGSSSSSSITGSNLSSDFSDSKQARTLLLRFHREVASSDMADALGDALISKVGEESSAKFSSFILGMVGSDRLKKGSDIFITCKGEKLSASLTTDGKDGSTINIKGLCSAIFQVYLGDSPVSPQAKEGFEKGFADLFAR